MRPYEHLGELTRTEREFLHAAPVIRRALQGEVTHELYLAFLTQAYHHVRHTVPLLMAVGARLQPRQQWLQAHIVRYLEEELGHERWILDDIAAAGGDAQAARRAAPSVQTDAMVAYAWDTVVRRNPIGFFGMVYVLEGTSVAFALAAAERIQGRLQLPERAFTYLRSHGRADQEHVEHLGEIIDRLDPDDDLPAVIACARSMFWLYGQMFRGLEAPVASARAGRAAA